MPRQSYAMEQFVKELTALRPSAKVTPTEPDGFGTYRTLEIDAKTAEWLSPVLRSIRDTRVRQRGQKLSFSSHPIAGEDRGSFSLATVAKILYPAKKAAKSRKRS